VELERHHPPIVAGVAGVAGAPGAVEPFQTRKPRFPLLYVVGVAQCGSTLLGRLLDMHPQVVCVGEMLRMDRALEANLPCGCGVPIRECPFWQPLLGLVEGSTRDLDFQSYKPELYQRIAARRGKDLIVDLSKSRVWRLTRRWRRDDVGYIFMVRDSRGVMGSAARRGRDIERMLRRHKKWMNRYLRFVEEKGGRGLIVRYEDLCRDPAKEVRRVCAFLGLDFHPRMLRPADAAHHFVHSSASPYLKGTNEIRLDERWREDLTPEQVDNVERVMQTIRVFQPR
jgi:hypothetical protein